MLQRQRLIGHVCFLSVLVLLGMSVVGCSQGAQPRFTMAALNFAVPPAEEVEAPAEAETVVELEDATAELAPETEDQLAEIAQLLASTDADMILLQGLPSKEAFDDLLKKLKKRGMNLRGQGYTFFPEDGGGSGAAVMTRQNLASFRRPDIEPGSPLEDSQLMEALLGLPGGEPLRVYLFRLPRDSARQAEQAQALYDLTLPLRQSGSSLMLYGYFDYTDPLAVASKQKRGSAAAILSGSDTPAHYQDDLTDLYLYLWPGQRTVGAADGGACRVLTSPEFVADTAGKEDWRLLDIKVVPAQAGEGAYPRAVVAYFGVH